MVLEPNGLVTVVWDADSPHNSILLLTHVTASELFVLSLVGTTSKTTYHLI